MLERHKAEPTEREAHRIFFSPSIPSKRAKFDAVYEGVDPLTADDVADNVAYAVTRPATVQIADMVVFHTAQSGAKTVYHSKL